MTAETACTAPGCGKPPSEHLGWALGHNWRRVREVQPLAAGATLAPIDLQLPYAYDLHRMDQDPPSRLSSGAWEAAPGPMTEAYHAATYEVARVRLEHRYYGPLRVRVWQLREGEHQDQDAPGDAYALYVGDQTESISAELKAAVDRVHEHRTARAVDGPGCTPHTLED